MTAAADAPRGAFVHYTSRTQARSWTTETARTANGRNVTHAGAERGTAAGDVTGQRQLAAAAASLQGSSVGWATPQDDTAVAAALAGVPVRAATRGSRPSNQTHKRPRQKNHAPPRRLARSSPAHHQLPAHSTLSRSTLFLLRRGGVHPPASLPLPPRRTCPIPLSHTSRFSLPL